MDYRTAVVVDGRRRPVGLVGRSAPGQARAAQGHPGRPRRGVPERAGHRAGGDRRDPRPPQHRSIETRLPVRATFVPGRLDGDARRRALPARGIEPSREAATMMLAAVLSDTVVLTSPTVTDRDRRAAERLGEQTARNPSGFGRAKFEASSDVRAAEARRSCGAMHKTYELERRARRSWARSRSSARSCCRARRAARGARGSPPRGRARDRAHGHRHRRQGHHAARDGRGRGGRAAFGASAGVDGAIALPGIMSRKKQVAPKILRLRPRRITGGAVVPGARNPAGAYRRCHDVRDSDNRRQGQGAAPRARGARRRVPRAPARGGARPRGRSRARAVRAAHRLGQVGRLLPRHRAAARAAAPARR